MSADRDRILEQALKHELRVTPPATQDPALRRVSEGGCLDAETIAAWHDGALDAEQMSAAEMHASTCPHCQALLAAFARSSVTSAGTAGALATPGTFRWWRFALAPLAAAAAAVTLWMVVPEQQQIATRPAAPPAAVAVDKTQPRDAAPPAPRAATPPESRAAAAAAENHALDATGKRDVANNKLTEETARQDRQQVNDASPLKKETVVLQSGQAGAVAAPAPAAPAAPPIPAAAPAAAESKAAERAEPAATAGLGKSARLAFAEVDVSTLDRNIRWRAFAGRIERTSDGGTTWSLLRERPDEVVMAGSSPTTSVAWFAGRQGLVLVTIDAGAAFTTASLAEPLDIASVSATDDRSAVISTVSGRRFRTADRGRTWTPF